MHRQDGQSDRSRERSQDNFSEQLANGLGWFSIGLGLAEIAAPRKVAELIGVQDDDSTRNTLQLYGLREITAGVGILAQRRPVGWLWARVGGDLLDLATLMTALQKKPVDRTRVGIATAAVLGVTALDVICAQQLSDGNSSGGADAPDREFIQTIIINRSPEEVYLYWRNFQNLPTFMSHLESVETFGDRHSHWKAKGPGGTTFEWDAEVVQDRPNESISWRSVEGSDVENSGTVRFDRATGGRGTIVTVQMRYTPPGGKAGVLIAKLFGEEPKQQIWDDLRAFKQIMEIGEVVNSDASIHTGMHPAQPATR